METMTAKQVALKCAEICRECRVLVDGGSFDPASVAKDVACQLAKQIEQAFDDVPGESFVKYRRKQIAELADWHPGFNMTLVSVSEADRKAGSPKIGDKIARNPANHADRWLVAADYFAVNFEAVGAQAAQRAPDVRAVKMEMLLLDLMAKVGIYYRGTGGKYLGGVPYNELRDRYDALEIGKGPENG